MSSAIERVLFLKETQVFLEVDVSVLIHVANKLEPRSHRAGETIVRKGEYTGGIFLISKGEVEVTQERDGRDVKIARLNVSEIQGDVSVMDMHYLIAERDKGVKHYVDRHELGLFEVDETLRIMEEAGLEAQYQAEGLMPGRGLYIGLKK